VPYGWLKTGRYGGAKLPEEIGLTPTLALLHDEPFPMQPEVERRMRVHGNMKTRLPEFVAQPAIDVLIDFRSDRHFEESHGSDRTLKGRQNLRDIHAACKQWRIHEDMPAHGSAARSVGSPLPLRNAKSLHSP